MTESRPVFSRWNTNVSRQDFLDEVLPLVHKEGFRLSRDTDITEDVLDGVIENIQEEGDSFCPCRLKTDDVEENRKLICPCIVFHKEDYAVNQQCWCGLFVVDNVEYDEDLMGSMGNPNDFDYPIISLDFLQEKSVYGFSLSNKDYTLVRGSGNALFLLEGRCCHMGAQMNEGFVEEDALVCPQHGWKYNLKTGQTNHPGMDLRPGEVFVENGIAYLHVLKN